MARIFIGIVVAVVLIFSMGFVVFNRSKAAQEIAIKSTARISASAIEQSNAEEYQIVEYKVEDGDAWGTIAEKVGIGAQLGEDLLAVSENVHSLASIRAENLFRFYFRHDDLMRVEYDMDSEIILILEKDERGIFSARKEKIVYEINVITKRGSIENSLFETAIAEGISAGAILNMATIFGWDIDFTSSVQKGDSFVIAYEDRFRSGKYAGTGKILSAKFVNAGQEFYAFLYEDSEHIARYYNSEGRELKRQFLRSPLDYTRITSGFSYNRFHPILDTFTTHRAVDYAASSGTPVSATSDGTVNYVGWKGGNGMYVGIKHTNSYETGYAHLSAYAKGINIGAKVQQNQVIGFVGSTGLSTGPHLHYEIRKDGVLINPLRLDLPPGKMLNEEELIAFYNERDRLLDLLK